MSRDLAKTAKHAGIFSVWVFVNRGVSLLMLPIYTRLLSPADYGVLELLEMSVDIVSTLAGMGILSGLFKFYYQYQEQQNRNELISTTFILVLTSYGVFCLLCSLIAPQLSLRIFGTGEYTFYLVISLVNLFLQTTLCFVPLAFLRTQQRSALFVAVSSVKLVMQVALNILFVVYLRMGVRGVLFSTMIASLVVGLFLAVFTFKQVGFHFSRQKAAILYRFGYPVVFSSLATFILTFSDRFFLNHYRDVSNVGVYSLAYKFGVLVQTFPMSPIMNIWLVQRFEIVAKGGYEQVFNKFITWLCILALASGLLISVTVRDVLRVMSAPEFWDAYKIVPVIVLAYFLQGCTDFFNFGIYHTSRMKHLAYGNIMSGALIIGLSFMLIPRYGMQGAAWATLLAFAFRLWYIFTVSQKLFAIRFTLFKPLATLGAAVLVYLVYVGVLQLRFLDSVAAAPARTVGLLLFYFGLLTLFRIITERERQFVFSFIRAPRRALAEIRSELA